MPRRPLSSLTLVLLLVASLGVFGCGRSTERRGVSGESSAGTVSVGATSSAGATGSDEPSGSAADQSGQSGANEPVKTGPLDAGEAEALKRELEALERELESIDMPSDSDFQDIEGALE